MKKKAVIQHLAVITILLMALYAVCTSWTDIAVRFSSYQYINGEEQPIDPDFSQMPALLRLGNRASTYGLFFLGLTLVFTAPKDKRLTQAKYVYGAAWVWCFYLLLTKTTTPILVLTSTFFSNFAPGILGILGIFFLSANEELWERSRDFIAGTIIFLGLLIFAFAPFVEAGSRFSGRRYMGSLATILQVCCVAPIFLRPRRIPRFFCYVPLAATVVCGVLIQTRLTFVMTLVQIFGVVILKRKRILKWVLHPSLSFGQTVALFSALGGCVVVLLALTVGPFRASLDALRNRLTEDTRTKQASTFFDKVPLSSLLLGVGYPVGDEFTSQGGEGIDSGYVNAAYVGGLPAAFVVFYFVALPGVRLLGSPDVEEALEAAPVCLSALVGFTSSNVFDISPGGVVFMILFAGRAYGLAQRRKVRRFQPAPVLRRGIA